MKGLETRFGALLKELRNKKGLTQEELATDCGLDRTYIFNAGKRPSSANAYSMFKIAEVLNVSPSSIVKQLE